MLLSEIKLTTGLEIRNRSIYVPRFCVLVFLFGWNDFFPLHAKRILEDEESFRMRAFGDTGQLFEAEKTPVKIYEIEIKRPLFR